MKADSTKKGRLKKDVVIRKGSVKRMPLPIYPKIYTVRVDYNLDTGETLITRTAEGFNAWELYGLLHVLMRAIERQMLIKPEDKSEVD